MHSIKYQCIREIFAAHFEYHDDHPCRHLHTRNIPSSEKYFWNFGPPLPYVTYSMLPKQLFTFWNVSPATRTLIIKRLSVFEVFSLPKYSFHDSSTWKRMATGAKNGVFTHSDDKNSTKSHQAQQKRINYFDQTVY